MGKKTCSDCGSSNGVLDSGFVNCTKGRAQHEVSMDNERICPYEESGPPIVRVRLGERHFNRLEPGHELIRTLPEVVLRTGR